MQFYFDFLLSVKFILLYLLSVLLILDLSFSYATNIVETSNAVKYFTTQRDVFVYGLTIIRYATENIVYRDR